MTTKERSSVKGHITRTQPISSGLESQAGSGLVSTGTDLQKRLLRDMQFGDKGGNAIKVQLQSLVPDLLKITKAERIEEMVLIHVWLSGIKALPDTNSYF